MRTAKKRGANSVKSKSKRASKGATADGHSYLTKRMTISRARMAGRRAASNAMQVMGFVVVARGRQIVKKYSDGKTEVIGNISCSNKTACE